MTDNIILSVVINNVSLILLPFMYMLVVWYHFWMKGKKYLPSFLK